MIDPTRRFFSTAFAVLVLVFAASPANAQTPPSWLDQQPLPQWNTPGMAIPTAPPFNDPGFPDNRCAESARPVETPEDQALVDAGWTLFGTYESGWGLRIVGALAGYDGMCRPWPYQFFVFVDGVFAGTVSPEPMASRADGSAGKPMVGFADTLYVSYSRYADADPLCCPSATSYATFAIRRMPQGPVVVVDQVGTSQHSGS